jgi:hypothetical protein
MGMPTTILHPVKIIYGHIVEKEGKLSGHVERAFV